MKISVITPNYNHSAFLEQAILSVLTQTIPPHEYIIIDDASTDSSVEIIKKFERVPLVKTVYREKNEGILYNINEGLKVAVGDFILFLAADDFVEPTLIEDYKEVLKKHPDVGFVCSRSNKVDIYNHKMGEYQVSKKIPSGFIPPQKARDLIFQYGPWFYGNTILLNRKKVLEMGGFNPNLLSYVDGYVYLSLALKYGLIYIDKVLSNCRRHEASYSMDTYRNIKKLTHIKKEVLTLMQKEQSVFDKSFIKRWIQRWNYIEFNAKLISKLPIPTSLKFIISGVGYIYFRWFDLFNLRLLDIKAFLRECLRTKSSSSS